MNSPETSPVASLKNVFPFLSLPAEIRNIVYKKLLVRDLNAEATCHTQIMQTCKQVNQETTGILYGENVVPVFVTSKEMLLFKGPIFATHCPLRRIVKMEVTMRILFDFWDYEELDPKKVRGNIMWVCHHLAMHAHAIRELTLKIKWSFPRSCGEYHDPEVEEMILSQFSRLRNIPTVNIEASTSHAFNQALRDEMARATMSIQLAL